MRCETVPDMRSVHDRRCAEEWEIATRRYPVQLTFLASYAADTLQHVLQFRGWARNFVTDCYFSWKIVFSIAQ